MHPEPPLLTTEEVAHRLGVKAATVYAYVSRGLLTSRRNADGKGSLFAKPDVDAFVAGRKRTTTPGIQTGITLIKDGALFYRGRDACVLARTASFESVATLLWTGDLEHVDLVAQRDLLSLAHAVIGPLPPAARHTDRLRVIVAAAAAADPLRFDTSPAAVIATGRTMLATMVTALPFCGVLPMGDLPLAHALWHRLTVQQPTDEEYATLNAALVLLADHDLAASTLAARIAASTRAHPYAVVGAGLAALDGPLHGAASGLAYALLAEAMTKDAPVTTIADRLRLGTPIPGFGHHLYPDGDPRATTLLEMLPDGPVRACAERLADAMRTRSASYANIDFAVAALALHHGMPADAGETIFAVARTAGWLAHALEEYTDRPSRFRPSGQYAGRRPTL
ncbi:citrate/2-methylcitrate synthase [Micromonosporaceae bacterium Da 78-11]